MKDIYVEIFPWIKNRKNPQNWDLARAITTKLQDKTNDIALEDTDEEWRFFDWWEKVDNFDMMVVKEWKIVSILWKKWKKLSLWDFIKLKWDSQWYISSGHWDWEMVTITNFVQPFQWKNTDKIIWVVWSDGMYGFIKPNNIYIDGTEYPLDTILEPLIWFNKDYRIWTDEKIDGLFKSLNTFCMFYENSWIRDWVLSLDPNMPNAIKDDVRRLAQRIILEMQK